MSTISARLLDIPARCVMARSRLGNCFKLPTNSISSRSRRSNNLCLNIVRLISSQNVYQTKDSLTQKRQNMKSGPPLSHFLSDTPDTLKMGVQGDGEDYMAADLFHGNGKKVYMETYGCQMNVNDTEITWSILLSNGYIKASNVNEADAVFLVTCSIREGAEDKIWDRVKHLTRKKKDRGRRHPLKIGILGCMAERLKHKIVEKEKLVDIVCGPDAYRDLPRLLAISLDTDQTAVNVQLSLEETYADVVPVRLNPDSPSAFVSIMRGCDNMCTYCIVPFTRGKERSRQMTSIIQEIQDLSDQGVKDVTLLGQNVNSYRDLSTTELDDDDTVSQTKLSAGFSTVYKTKTGGRRFAKLLEEVALINPEMRIRFTSPHPKDFPDEVLQTILNYPNICKQIHLPAQSGNSEVLASMGRGYTREAYVQLVHHIRGVIPGVALSSDFIAGFCGESEDAHADTLSLLDIVRYNFVYSFPYSMRQKTRAFHRLDDNVSKEVKLRRNEEIHNTFRRHAEELHHSQIGEIHLVLVEGESRRSSEDFAGRNDANTKVIFQNVSLKSGPDLIGTEALAQAGDYVAVELTSSTSQGFRGRALYRTMLQNFVAMQNSATSVSNINARVS